MLKTNQLVGFGGGGGLKPALTFIEESYHTGSPATVTRSVNIGAEQPNRLVVVGNGFYNGAGASAVTVNGVSATLISDGTSAFGDHEIWAAVVPTGTTVNVVLTNPYAQYGMCSIGIWVIHNLISTTADVVNMQSAAADLAAQSISTKADGVAIVVGTIYKGTPNTPTYSVVAANYDRQSTAGSTNIRFHGASGIMPITGTNTVGLAMAGSYSASSSYSIATWR